MPRGALSVTGNGKQKLGVSQDGRKTNINQETRNKLFFFLERCWECERWQPNVSTSLYADLLSRQSRRNDLVSSIRMLMGSVQYRGIHQSASLLSVLLKGYCVLIAYQIMIHVWINHVSNDFPNPQRRFSPLFCFTAHSLFWLISLNCSKQLFSANMSKWTY